MNVYFMTWNSCKPKNQSEYKFTTADFWIKNRPITHGVQNFEMEIKLLQLPGFTSKVLQRGNYFFWWNFGNQKQPIMPRGTVVGGVTWPRNYEPALQIWVATHVCRPCLLGTWIVAIIFIAAFCWLLIGNFNLRIIKLWLLINTNGF